MKGWITMARPKVEPHEKRSASISAAVSERTKYQVELAAGIQGFATVGAFVESAVLTALRKVKMPTPTGIPLEAQKGLWQSIKWVGGEKTFANADVRNRLSEFIVSEPPTTSVADEIILWDEDPAIRFFLKAYLVSDLLSPHESDVWDAIQAKTVIMSVRHFSGVEYKSQRWDQHSLESYFLRNWSDIKQVLEGILPVTALPDEKQIINEDSHVKPKAKGKTK
jgi:hypothetical protein